MPISESLPSWNASMPLDALKAVRSQLRALQSQVSGSRDISSEIAKIDAEILRKERESAVNVLLTMPDARETETADNPVESTLNTTESLWKTYTDRQKQDAMKELRAIRDYANVTPALRIRARRLESEIDNDLDGGLSI